ncbi:PH domain-like [Cinara cedri]|uniref:PH domain-like n=1 Tax=Cinara cedri TaxID=506608 RepID=A0A5E4NBE1_9HEMI|nr:PH domain-like [Cinara cedri]
MSDKPEEFSQRMLERALKRQELLSTVVTSRILEPLEIPESAEPRALSEISELSVASQLSPSESLYSPAPKEPTIPDVSSALTQPSVTESSVPSKLTESLVTSALAKSSIPQTSTESFVPPVSSKYYVNTVEPSVSLYQRRQRLTELANRIDLWTSEEETSRYAKSNEVKTKSSTHNIQLEAPVETITSTNKEKTRLATKPSSGLTKINEKCGFTKSNIFNELDKLISLPPYRLKTIKKHNITDAFGNNSISSQQFHPIPVHNSLDDNVNDYKIKVNETPSVAARRAIFEKFTAQPQNTKSVSTTNVSVSVPKTTSAIANSSAVRSMNTVENKSSAVTDNANATVVTPTTEIANDTNMIDTLSKSPKSLKYSHLSMRTPSEYRTFGSTSPVNCDTWNPPCIKNVLFKKKSSDTLDTLDNMCDDDGVLATSSPCNTSIESPADKIVKSVGRVQFMSPLSTNGLYPKIEVIDNIKNETISIESENQLSSSKRRNDGSNTFNSSTQSFESLSKYSNDDDESIVAKRRCEFGVVDTNLIAIKTETPSLLSDSDGTFSQTSNSFTFYQPPNNELCQDDVDTKPLAFNGLVDSEKSQDFKETGLLEEPKERLQTHTFTQSPLIHTVSMYRKQQQLRLANNKMKTNEQYEEESPKNNYIDDEEEVRALEITAERIEILENTVKEQNSIISQATQALNISDMYRQKASQSDEYSNEHLHAERLLLIANLKRTDAVLEVQRLRYEHHLSPTGIAGGFRFRPPGNGKRLVIDSLRIPLLTAVRNCSTKNKSDPKTLTKWPQEIRYFVCVVRATATVYRPPITTATRPLDAIKESIYRFTVGNRIPYNELGYGYVEFIIKPNSSSGRRYPDAEGAPIIIDGLDNSGWKITVELYGLYPTASNVSSGNDKEHHEKSVLDKLWSSVTPNKESKKHNFSKVPKIESPGGSSAVRTSMYRQLAYFVFSSNEVGRRQFTLNKVHQSGGITSTSKSAVPIDEPEVARICMQMLEDGEEYVQSDLNGSISSTSHEENLVIKPLKLPSKCKITEGFITLFDDFALRIPFEFESNEIPRWQNFSNNNTNSLSNALWTRLWFKVEIINDPNAQKDDQNYEIINKEKIYPQTVILKYWLYPEHFEQNREPRGIIDLSGCLPLLNGMLNSSDLRQSLPIVQPFLNSSIRPNTVRLLFSASYQIHNADNYRDDNVMNEPLLLAFDTLKERDEWCNTINEAVNAIAAHHEQFNIVRKFRD